MPPRDVAPLFHCPDVFALQHVLPANATHVAASFARKSKGGDGGRGVGNHHTHQIILKNNINRFPEHVYTVATCIYRALHISFFGPQKVHRSRDISRSER
jgi:hypothetical protein